MTALRNTALRWSVACSLAGVGVGVLVGIVEPTRYAARETLVIVRGSAPLTGTEARSDAETIRALADGRVVVANVAQSLNLKTADVQRDVSVSLVGGTAALQVRGTAHDSTGAVRLVQQYGVVLTEFVRARLAPLGLTVFDPPHTVGRVTPPWTRNLLWGALFGALAGGALSLVRGGPRRPFAPAVLPAPPPGSFRDPAPPALAAMPEPEPEPEPEQEQEQALEPANPGAWTVGELRQRVESARTARPDRMVEWETYLALLEQHAVRGVLPASFDALIDDVFGSLLY
jgi:hypothetical protein